MIKQGAQTTLANQLNPFSIEPGPTGYSSIESGYSISLPVSNSRETVNDKVQNVAQTDALPKRRLDEEPGSSRPTNRQRQEAPSSTNELGHTASTPTQAMPTTRVVKSTGMYVCGNRSVLLMYESPTTS